MSRLNRRELLKHSVAATTAATLLPSFAKGEDAKSDKLNFAVIGCANRGAAIGSEAVRSSMTHCVALCDVVPSRAEGFKNKMGDKCEDAVIFDDFREMFEKMGDKIDACTIGTPDHSHFPIAMLAMSLGIHVYVEKPLAHTFEECELLMAAEKKIRRHVSDGKPRPLQQSTFAVSIVGG